MELFARNSDSEQCKQKWLNNEDTLQVQEVADGAQICVGVHGMRGSSNDPATDPETGELLSNDPATDPETG